MASNFDNIPLEYRSENKFVVWKRDKNSKTPYKLTRKAYTKELSLHGRASNKEPSDWTDLATVIEAVEAGIADGIGSPIIEGHVFVDIDHCIVDGKVSPEAQATIDRLNSYTEISQSGTGVHILVKGTKPTEKCRKNSVEIYDHSRYIYLTGDILDNRKTIEERDVGWLCEETFGESDPQVATVALDDLVLDRDAKPPPDKLEVLLEDKDFQLVWEHRKRSLPSLSDYDYRLACCAIEAEWSPQEIADLIIAFREAHGDKEDREKSLRKDYIPRTIAKARASQLPSGVRKLLPFKVVKVLQYGEANSRFSLVVNEGREISMGRTEEFITPKLANARLLEAGLVLSKRVMDRWLDIIRSLQPLIEIIPTTTREDDTRAWLDDYINSRVSLPMIKSDDDIKSVFGSGLNSLAEDKEGRLYLRLSDVTRYSAVHSGLRGISSQSVAADLVKMGFKKRELRIKGEGRSRQVTIWISEPGFVDQGGGEE